jgi:hypothetical protein
MNILDVYTKKEYECRTCKAAIYYAKIADDTGALYTTDGQLPNGKFGKESNILSGAVDVHVKDRLHKCSEKFVLDKIKQIEAQRNTQEQKTMEESSISPQETPVSSTPPKTIMSGSTLVEWTKTLETYCNLYLFAENHIKENFPNIVEPQARGMIFKEAIRAFDTMVENNNGINDNKA